MRLFRGPCPAYQQGGGNPDGTQPPSDALNAGTGRGYACLFVARKELEVTRLLIANRHGADAKVMIAVTTGLVNWTSLPNTNTRFTADAGVNIPMGQTYEWETVLTVAGDDALNISTNIAIFGISAITLDISGRAV